MPPALPILGGTIPAAPSRVLISPRVSWQATTQLDVGFGQGAGPGGPPPRSLPPRRLDLDGGVALGAALLPLLKQQLHDPVQLLLAERLEDDDLVHPVEELRPEEGGGGGPHVLAQPGGL